MNGHSKKHSNDEMVVENSVDDTIETNVTKIAPLPLSMTKIIEEMSKPIESKEINGCDNAILIDNTKEVNVEESNASNWMAQNGIHVEQSQLNDLNEIQPLFYHMLHCNHDGTDELGVPKCSCNRIIYIYIDPNTFLRKICEYFFTKIVFIINSKFWNNSIINRLLHY